MYICMYVCIYKCTFSIICPTTLIQNIIGSITSYDPVCPSVGQLVGQSVVLLGSYKSMHLSEHLLQTWVPFLCARWVSVKGYIFKGSAHKEKKDLISLWVCLTTIQVGSQPPVVISNRSWFATVRWNYQPLLVRNRSWFATTRGSKPFVGISTTSGY